MNNQGLYLDDYSMEDIIDLLKLKKNIELEDNDEEIKEKKDKKPSFIIKPDFNSKGEKVVIFSINIPLNNRLNNKLNHGLNHGLNNGLKIDILINDEMFKNIEKHFNL